MVKRKFTKKTSGLYVPVKARAVKKRRNWLERKLDEYNHTMELIRTILPLAVLIIQVIILMKIL
ncbi:MAG: hypothetical protein CMA64_05045 [Euryarchaeota archaeon]|nr:hypothetical protein [Euryarchaeota archaeon]